MAQTFDIRFARSAGLAAMLEVPENAFRWKGGGLLRIDAHGISIGLKRGLLALLGGKRTQRIPTENLRAVYREGDALRVEFQDGNPRASCCRSGRTIARPPRKIVRLLPTSQTVEIEHSTGPAFRKAARRLAHVVVAGRSARGDGRWEPGRSIHERRRLLLRCSRSQPIATRYRGLAMPDSDTAMRPPRLMGTPEPRRNRSRASCRCGHRSPEAKPDFLEPPPRRVVAARAAAAAA